jgi:hypothetical protein
MAREMALTVFCLKPAIDALRVAGGSEKEHYEMFSPFVELMVTKLSEVSPI